MIIFNSCLDDEKQCNELGANLPGLSLALAHSCRESLGRSWGYKVKQLEGDYQEVALAYQKRLLTKRSNPENRKVGAPAAGLNKPKENRIGAFTTIACLRGLCYLLDVTSFDARMS